MRAQDETIDPVLIDLPMPIRTPRLLIRPVQPGDGAMIHEAKRETWDMLARWMSWAGDGLGTAARTEAQVRKMYAAYILRQDALLIGLEREGGRLAVCTGFHDIDWNIRRFATGYWVPKSKQGRGYATEAGNAVLRYLFGALGARRVEIRHYAGNEASHNVIKKLGYKPEGIKEKAYLRPDGSIVCSREYARLTADGLPALDMTWGPG